MRQGGFGFFCFYEIATAVDGFGFDDNKRMWRRYDEKIPPRDPGNLSRAPSPRQYPLETRRYLLEKGYPLETRRYPLEKSNLVQAGDLCQFHPWCCLQIICTHHLLYPLHTMYQERYPLALLQHYFYSFFYMAF
jgi:hypothetical protein